MEEPNLFLITTSTQSSLPILPSPSPRSSSHTLRILRCFFIPSLTHPFTLMYTKTQKGVCRIFHSRADPSKVPHTDGEAAAAQQDAPAALNTCTSHPELHSSAAMETLLLLCSYMGPESRHRKGPVQTGTSGRRNDRISVIRILPGFLRNTPPGGQSGNAESHPNVFDI